MALVMGVDSSTTSTKVEVRDAEDGRLVASGQAPHPPSAPPRSEVDAEEWWRALAASAAEARSRFPVGRSWSIAAVSVAAQQHGLVVVDDQGMPLRPAKLWNDTESAPEARDLVGRLGAEAWAQACGSVPVASLTVSKLAWLARHEPQVLASADRILLPHDWLTSRLCGRAVTDRGDASGTGYWSPAEGRWRLDLLELVDASCPWGDLLPEVLGPAEAAGRLTPEAERHLSAVVGGADGPEAIVGPGTGDNMAAALGVGLRPGCACVSIGTSGTVYARSPVPVADPSGAVAGFADATGGFLPLVCTLNATRVTDAFARVAGVDPEGFDRMALEAPPGAGGLVLLPYLDGERTPDRPSATGILAGIRSDLTPAHLARAAVEGVVCGLLDGLDALEGVGVDTGTGPIVLVGGGARSPAFRRVLADLSGRPVVVPGGEHVARGACVQAAAVLGGGSPSEVATSWSCGRGEEVEPDLTLDAGSVRARYAALRDR
jgi:xylulokinase